MLVIVADSISWNLGALCKCSNDSIMRFIDESFRPKQPSSRNYRGRDRHSRAVGEVPMRRDFPQWSDMSESNENVSCPSPFERMHSRDRSQLRTPKRQTDADAPPRARHSSDESDLMFKIVGRPNRKQPSSEPVRYRTPTDHLIDGASVRDSVQRRQDGERTSSKVPDPTFENAPTKDCDGPLKRKFGILPKSVWSERTEQVTSMHRHPQWVS